jgi:uncharacterized protein
MLYRKMEKTGDELSVLGFGCMRLPQKSGTPGEGKIDEKRATAQVRYAIDQGVNYIDTAMPYHRGAGESFVGRALGEGYRDKVRLATKLPPWSLKTHDDMDRLLSAQLDRLATDRIDYYLLHGLYRESWDKMKAMNAMGFLEKAKADGRIVNEGFSFHGDIDTFKEIVDAYDWSFCQIQYNFMDEHNQAGTEGLKYAAAKGLGVVVMEPLRGGHLAGKVPREVDAIWREADVTRSAVEWALRWVWNHPELTVVLSGMNDEAHIKENIRIAGEALPNSLTERDLDLVSRVEAAYRKLTKAGCTGCGYCMPCPSGVDIPTCFQAYDMSHMFNEVRSARMAYLAFVSDLIRRDAAYASLCKDCGKCEEKCPQGLKIPELLNEVAKEFEDRKMSVLIWVAKRFLAVQRLLTIRKGKRIENRHKAKK